MARLRLSRRASVCRAEMCPSRCLTWKMSEKSLLSCLEGKGEGRCVPKTMPAMGIPPGQSLANC